MNFDDTTSILAPEAPPITPETTPEAPPPPALEADSVPAFSSTPQKKEVSIQEKIKTAFDRKVDEYLKYYLEAYMKPYRKEGKAAKEIIKIKTTRLAAIKKLFNETVDSSKELLDFEQGLQALDGIASELTNRESGLQELLTSAQNRLNGLNEKLAQTTQELQTKESQKRAIDAQVTRWIRSYEESDVDSKALEESQRTWGAQATAITREISQCKRLKEQELPTLIAAETNGIQSLLADIFDTFARLQICEVKFPPKKTASATPVRETTATSSSPEKKLNFEVDLAHLTHYCYKANGDFGDFPLEKIRLQMVTDGFAKTTVAITPHELESYVKRNIQLRKFDPKTVLGFDPTTALAARRLENSATSMATTLTNVTLYQHDSNGAPSTKPLESLQTFLEHTLGYPFVKDASLPKNFQADIEAGRITAAMINAVVGFDVTIPVRERKQRAEAAAVVATEGSVRVHFGNDAALAPMDAATIPQPKKSAPPPPLIK